jgi:hypothetical protein
MRATGNGMRTTCKMCSSTSETGNSSIIETKDSREMSSSENDVMALSGS